MKRLILLILITFFLSCTQNKEVINPEWPLKFVVVFKGDKKVSTITLAATIGYPLENELTLQGTIKSILKDEEYFLNQFDSIKLISSKNVYTSCIATIKVGVAIFNPVEISERYIYYEKTDTIKTEKDSLFTVVWPRDSALFSPK